jgi:hypothetical protein
VVPVSAAPESVSDPMALAADVSTVASVAEVQTPAPADLAAASSSTETEVAGVTAVRAVPDVLHAPASGVVLLTPAISQTAIKAAVEGAAVRNAVPPRAAPKGQPASALAKAHDAVLKTAAVHQSVGGWTWLHGFEELLAGRRSVKKSASSTKATDEILALLSR